MEQVISIYTQEEAVEDGVLLPLESYFVTSSFRDWLLVGLRKLSTQDGHFPLGSLFITALAAVALKSADVLMALIRHHSGDWGEACEEDRQANQTALSSGRRLFSIYLTSDNTRFWIITEADRSATTVLLPEDY